MGWWKGWSKKSRQHPYRHDHGGSPSRCAAVDPTHFLRSIMNSQMLHFLRAPSYLHPRNARKSIFAINPRKTLEGGGTGKSGTLFLTSNGKLSQLPYVIIPKISLGWKEIVLTRIPLGPISPWAPLKPRGPSKRRKQRLCYWYTYQYTITEHTNMLSWTTE